VRPLSYERTIRYVPYSASAQGDWENSAGHRHAILTDSSGLRLRLYEYRWALPIPLWLGRVLSHLFGEVNQFHPVHGMEDTCSE
jgi:hypothetical protein